MNIEVFILMLISMIIAILSGLGVGSGGLFVIWLTEIYGINAVQARGMNLLFFVCSATAAMIVHFLKGKIKPKLVAWLTPFAFLGTIVGIYAGQLINPSLLKKIFGIMLVFAGSLTLFRKKYKIFSKPLYKAEFL